MAAFIGTLPCRTCQGLMASEDEAEGEVARRCASLTTIMDGEQQHKAGAPVGRRRRGPIRTKATAMQRLFVAHSRTESGRQMIVVRDDQIVMRVRRGHMNAKAEPNVSSGDDHIAVGSKTYLSKAIKAGQQRDSDPGIGNRQHDDIGCGRGRP